MEIQIPPFQEKRQFGRVKIPQPKLWHVYVPQSHKIWENRGIIQNISLGGIHCLFAEEPPLDKDDAKELTFDAIYNDQKIYRLKFHGSIVRIEDGPLDCSQVTVAFKFLSDPIFYPLTQINQAEMPSLDKIRILYQYYALSRKAYEIIQRTPEVREGKITDVKERIDQGLYKIESDKLAQSLTNTILEDNSVLPKK